MKLKGDRSRIFKLEIPSTDWSDIEYEKIKYI